MAQPRQFNQSPQGESLCAKHTDSIAEMDKVTSLLKLEITNIKDGQSEMKSDVKEMKIDLKKIDEGLLTLNTDKKWAGMLAAGIAGAAGSVVAIFVQIVFSGFIKK